MTDTETKNFSQNVSSSYYLRGECSDECKKDSLNVPKLRFKGYNDEWKQNKLGNLFEIKAGGDIDNKKLSKNKNEQYKYPVYANALQNNGLYGYSDIYKISGETITVTGRGDVGHAIARKENYYPIVRLLILKPIVKQDVDFWANAINNTRIFVESTGVPQLTAPQLAKIKIYYPSLPEQEKIASFLTLIDKKIEKQKELIELLKKYKRGLLSQIFSQKLRFKDDNGNDYPEWKEKTLGEVTNNISYGLNAASKAYDGENKYIRITDIDETTGKYNNLDIVSPDCDLSDEYKLKNDDLLFTRTGASTGKTYLYNKNDGKMYFAGFLIKFSIKEEYCSNFVFYITQTFNYKKWVSIMSTRSGQPGINAKEYSKYKFLCPVYDEQIKISNIVLKIDNIIEKETLLLSFYNNYKKGLLQQMFI